MHDPRQLDPADLRPHLPLDALKAGLASASGRHVRAARSAADLVRAGAESPFETLLRLLILDAGLPEPECGFELRDGGGRWIGWFDLAWPRWRVIAEYDGDQHRTSTRQYERDISRFDRADEAGWKVVRVRQRGILVDRGTTRRRISEALARRGCPL